jgi:hypothetical protein
MNDLDQGPTLSEVVDRETLIGAMRKANLRNAGAIAELLNDDISMTTGQMRALINKIDLDESYDLTESRGMKSYSGIQLFTVAAYINGCRASAGGNSEAAEASPLNDLAGPPAAT